MNNKVIFFLFAVVVCAFLQVTSVSAIPPAACREPLVTGPCRARKTRFGYDLNQRKCVPFTYGGCQGNSNNFQTMEECERRCMYPR